MLCLTTLMKVNSAMGSTMSVSKEQRNEMEHKEARVWKDLVRTPKSALDFSAKKMTHAELFEEVRSIQNSLPSFVDTCVVCGEPSQHKCGGCQDEYYCGKACQKLDWKSRHRAVCRKTKKEILEMQAAAITEEVRKPCTSDKNHAVVVLLRKSHFVVHMNQEQMMDYGLFCAAIKEVAPSFDAARDHGWQHWQTVREAFNPHR